MNIMKSLFLCSVAGAGVLPLPVLAQDDAGATPVEMDAAAEKVVSEQRIITVTARKREESVLNVPVVMTALPQEALTAYGTHDLKTLSARVPGFVVGESLAANGVQVSMRGVGTSVNNATVDQSVSLNIDGLQLSQGLAYQVGMFDLAQAEVLKGPQALFFGKNSPAGVVSLRSNDPTDEFEAIFRLGYEFEAQEKIGEAIVSGPLTDSLGARFAVRYSDKEGFFNNGAKVIPGLGARNPENRNVTPTDNLIMRGTLLFEPTSRYSARLKASYDNLKLHGHVPASQIGFCPDGTAGVAPVNIPFLQGDDCTLDDQVNVAWPDPAAFPGISNGGDPYMDQEQLLFSLEQSLDVSDELNLTSVTTYYDIDQRYLFIASTFPATVSLVADSGYLADQFTQELRLSTGFADLPVNFLLGGFYQQAEQSPRVNLIGNTFLGLPATLQKFDSFVDIESVSAFGQVLWDVTANLELSAGARWTQETRRHKQVVGGVDSVLLVPKIKSDNISPEFTATYKPTDNVTLFAAYRTGYKSGSFNAVVQASPTTNASFADESVEGGEIGLKTILVDGQLQLNAAIYDYEYSDLQVGANEIDGQTGALVLRTLNAASASVEGVEMDFTYTPYMVEGLTFYGAVNYNKARYSSFPNAACGNGQSAPQGCDQLPDPVTGRFTSQDLTGEPLVRAPDWIANAGFTYEFPVNQDMHMELGSYANYSSGYSTNLTNRAGYYQDGYTKVNASIALKGADDDWELALIGNNLGNEIIHSNSFNTNSQNGVVFGGQIQGGPTVGPAGNDEATMVADRGREVWIRFTMRFGG